jgi:uncharacterized protein (TIGR03382 family)
MKFLSYGAAGVLAASLLSTSAFAFGAGKTGSSGKSGSQPCTMCHNGGTAPTVEISGPTTLAAGATGQYTLIIRGGAAVKAGMNVAASDAAASLEPGSATEQKKEAGELTHKTSKAFSNGEARFDFSLIAPSTAGTVTLFGAGNSTNGNGTAVGDMSATTTLNVTVSAGNNPTPDDNEEPGGCSSTGGAPALMFVLAAAGVTLLRRRHG